jgi:5'-3' exonuclease
MGITGLWDHINKKIPKAKKKTSLAALATLGDKKNKKGAKGAKVEESLGIVASSSAVPTTTAPLKKIAIDGNMGMYKLIGQTGKNPQAMASRLKSGTLIPLRKAGLEPIIVFDGPMHLLEKNRTGEKRNKRKQDVEEKIAIVKEKYDEEIKAQTANGTLGIVPGTSSASAVQAAPLVPRVSKFIDIPLIIDGEIIGGTDVAVCNKAADDDDDTLLGVSLKPATRISSTSKKQPTTSTSKDVTEVKSKFSKGITEKLNAGDYAGALTTLENQTHKIDQETCNAVRKILEADGWMCIRSDSEGDFVMAHLAINNHVDYVLADDGDLFTFGVKKLVRKLSDHLYHPDSCPLEVYSLHEIVEEMKDFKFKSHKQFVETCILAKCDYTPVGVKGIGFVKAYNAIIKHGSIEKYLETVPKSHYDPSYPDDVKKARDLFLHPKSEDYFLGVAAPIHELFESLDPEIRKLRRMIMEYAGTEFYWPLD